MTKLDPYELEVLQTFEAGRLKPGASKAELAHLRAGASRCYRGQADEQPPVLVPGKQLLAANKTT